MNGPDVHAIVAAIIYNGRYVVDDDDFTISGSFDKAAEFMEERDKRAEAIFRKDREKLEARARALAEKK